VPGNHERSRIPVQLWSLHENLHVFDVPRTYLCRTAAGTIALAGFPFLRAARGRLRDLVRRTHCDQAEADARLLCMHQVVEGAVVGAQNYCFRSGPEVIAGGEVPAGYAAVLSGHIHRAQTLTHDLRWRQLATPVVFAGAIERTSFAERNEVKSYTVVTLALQDGGRLVHLAVVPLPARPMVDLVLEQAELGDGWLTLHLRERIAALDPNAVVRVHLRGAPNWEAHRVLTAPYLRSLAPESMNISLAIVRRKE
jgi:DNA repair protein SbcD/Mre11